MRRTTCFWVVGLLLLGGRALLAAEPAMEPFVVDWSSPADSPVDLSCLLSAPAGKDGFVRVADGHLVRPDGGRFRVWGINATGKACLPSKEDATKIAAHLARYGINCVRFHFLDVPAPRGLIAAGRTDTRALDPDTLDRMDFFIARLKDRGIYSDLNLNVARPYKQDDGVADRELLGFAKALTYFDPRLIELQKEYARQLLTHVNPYTHHEYRYEPAVAIVELVNENSIVESWFAGRLLGTAKQQSPGGWTDIPASYEKSLTELYNRWLGAHVAPDVLARLRKDAGVGDGPLPRLQPKEFSKASADRFHIEASFYMDLERRFFVDMGRYLREELGVKSLLVGNSDHNHYHSGYPLVASTSQLDIVDGHVYWQHPKYLTDPTSGKRAGFEIINSPMVNDPRHSSVVELSRTAMAGKPYTVSEVNHPFPNEYACEGIPILAAYGALHDWDGVFWYTLAHDDVTSVHTRSVGHFDLAPDPVRMSQMAAGALMFLRSDVRPARRVVERSYSREQVYESVRLPKSERPYYTPGFPLEMPLIHATRIASLDGPPTGTWECLAAAQLRSDTGEIAWEGAAAKQGLVIVDTGRSQALVGFCKANRAQSKNLATDVENTFCALTLSALDAQPIAESGRLLLTATARTANSGKQWNDARKSLTNWGKAPACIETVRGCVILRGLASGADVSAQPLDGAGHALGVAIHATKTAEGWRLTLGDRPTTWYLISVGRARAK